MTGKATRKTEPLAVVILAAGLGTRMKSDRPKVLHEVCGRPMLSYVIEAAFSVSPKRVVVVTGADQDAIADILPVGCERALQAERRGTGDAVRAGLEPLEGFVGDVVVLVGDAPLVDGEFLDGLVEAHRAAGSRATVATAVLDDPAHYGRVVRDSSGGCGAHRRGARRRRRGAAPERGQHRVLRLRRWPPARGAAASRAGQRAGRALPHRRRAPRPRRRRPGRRVRRRGARGDAGHQLTRRAGRGERPHAPPPARASHARRGHRRGPGDDLRRLGGRGRPRHRVACEHTPARAHDRRRRFRDRARLLPARRFRRRPCPGRRLAAPRLRGRLPLFGGPVRLHPAQHGARRGGEGRHLRRDQEQPYRRGQQGAAPELRRRRDRRPPAATSPPATSPPTTTASTSTRPASATMCTRAATRRSWRRSPSATAPTRRPGR